MKCLKHIVFTFFLCNFIFIAQAQQDSKNWYFGHKAGFQFEGYDLPTPLWDSEMQAVEGCASISDAEGNLLFYSDGETVWNRNHDIMANGTELGGDRRSSNSAFILKQPGNPNIYYLFVTEINCRKGGGFEKKMIVRINIIDLYGHGGLGEVVEKNKYYINGVSEKITAVPHSNKEDFWIINYQAIVDIIISQKFDKNGIGPLQRYTAKGYEKENCFFPKSFPSSGCIKASPDGTMIALADYESGYIRLFLFDSSSGSFVDDILFYEGNNPYGIEFSPNSKKLYVSFAPEDQSKLIDHLYQYDVEEFNLQKILDSRTRVVRSNISNQFDFGAIGALQLGPDDKIYVASRDYESSKMKQYIGRIEKPNSDGVYANYKPKAVKLRNGFWSTYGLPQFLNRQSSALSMFYTNVCIGDSTLFQLIGCEAVSVKWDFGESVEGVSATSTDFKPSHQYSKPGIYTVVATVVNVDGETQIIEREVEVYAYPEPNEDVVYRVESFYPGAIILIDEKLTPLISNDLENETVQLFETMEDAELGIHSIPNRGTFQTGEYYARVENKYSNCYTIVPVQIEVELLVEEEVIAACQPQFPNSFSPNNDGVNDQFLYFYNHQYNCIVDLSDFQVFNRWGEKVYSGSKLPWNGKTNTGENAEPGLYLYHLTYSYHSDYFEGEKLKRSGTVHIIY